MGGAVQVDGVRQGEGSASFALSRMFEFFGRRDADLIVLGPLGAGQGMWRHYTLDGWQACSASFDFPVRLRVAASSLQLLCGRVLACNELTSWRDAAPLSSDTIFALAPGEEIDVVLGAQSRLVWFCGTGLPARPAHARVQRTSTDNAYPQAWRERLPADLGQWLQHLLPEGLPGQGIQAVWQAHARLQAQSPCAHAGRGRLAHHRLPRETEIIVRSELRHEISMRRLCQATGASERTLRYALDDLLGISPNRFLAMWRLSAAYRALVAVRRERVSVKSVALECGWWDMSRFADRYRQVFGELPSQTLERHTLRGQPADALRE